MASYSFEGRVALITGSAVGIGRGVATVLARKGMHIAGLDIDCAENAQSAAEVRALGRECLTLACDIGDKQAVKQAVDAVIEHYGRIDVLINNAGYFDNAALLQGDYASQTAAFDRAMGASVLGSYYVTRAAVEALCASDDGNIVGMITDHVKPGHYLTGLPAVGYDAGKFGMWRQTETWALELKARGVRVNGLCFGAVDTPMLRNATEGLLETAMQPEDIGQAVVNILAHGVDGPTGETWLVAKTPEPRATGLAEIAALAPA